MSQREGKKTEDKTEYVVKPATIAGNRLSPWYKTDSKLSPSKGEAGVFKCQLLPVIGQG